MSQGRTWKLIAGLAVAAVLAAPATVMAQEEAPAGPNTGAVTFTLDQNIVTSYIFRGAVREDQGLIYQPSITINATLMESEDAISSLDVYATIWNSIHGDNTASTNSNRPWFETDYVIGAVLGLPAGLTLDSSVVFYTYPNGGLGAITELDFVLSYDDADLMAEYGLPTMNPYLLFAVELAAAGATEETYLELGIEPSFAVYESEDFPITLAVPVKVGMGLDNYYGDGWFGFVSAGLIFSTPLNMIPVEFGAWEASAGVVAVWADEAGSTALVGNQDDIEVYGTFGLTMTY